MKVTTLADGSHLQYIKVNDPLETRWISHASSRLDTNRPEHAQGFSPREALAVYQRLVSLGYKGLSITNALPDSERKIKVITMYWAGQRPSEFNGSSHIRGEFVAATNAGSFPKAADHKPFLEPACAANWGCLDAPEVMPSGSTKSRYDHAQYGVVYACEATISQR